MRQVAALFVRGDSIYKSMPGVDAWDIERDARRWPGGAPVVAHPPCRAWGRLAHMARPRPDEKDLARFAVAQIRRWGGVLEHPAFSTLWADQGLPAPGVLDAVGGFTLPVQQQWWGHRAAKATWLYIVGVAPRDIPSIPYVMGEPTHVVAASRNRQRLRMIPEITKPEREHTPPAFGAWLIELARRTRIDAARHAA